MTASWGNHLQMLGIRSQTAVVVVGGGRLLTSLLFSIFLFKPKQRQLTPSSHPSTHSSKGPLACYVRSYKA